VKEADFSPRFASDYLAPRGSQIIRRCGGCAGRRLGYRSWSTPETRVPAPTNDPRSGSIAERSCVWPRAESLHGVPRWRHAVRCHRARCDQARGSELPEFLSCRILSVPSALGQVCEISRTPIDAYHHPVHECLSLSGITARGLAASPIPPCTPAPRCQTLLRHDPAVPVLDSNGTARYAPP